MGKPPKTSEMGIRLATAASHCAVCVALCCDLHVNNATLCDAHFDAWLATPRDLSEGGPSAMGRFVAMAKAAR